MITVRRGSDRGRTSLGWLDSRHTFSFGDYHDPRHMGFRALRVINDDRVQPGKGFGSHGHRDMEIISYVIEGELAHEDSMGNGSVIRPGDVQRMSAGTGVTHSEFNPSPGDPARFLQIWIQPDRPGHQPGYAQRSFGPGEMRGRFRLAVSGDGREGSLTMNSDAAMLVAALEPGEQASCPIKPGRHAWVQVAFGSVTLEGEMLEEGDGAALSDETGVTVRADRRAEVLLFDLP